MTRARAVRHWPAPALIAPPSLVRRVELALHFGPGGYGYEWRRNGDGSKPTQGRIVVWPVQFAGGRKAPHQRPALPIELGARALDILIALTSTPNEVVSKKDLMARVWPDVIVEEGSLRFHMISLRKALGDGKDGARYIATLPGRGYCFVAPVSRATGAGDAATAAPANFPHANLPNR